MDVPIEFTHKGVLYKGVFVQVSGGGSATMWHLTISNYHYGQLILTDRYGFKWGSNSNQDFEEHLDWFEFVMISAYQ